MSENTYRQFIVELVERAHSSGRPRNEVREEIVSYVHSAYNAGETWAIETLTRWETSGADSDYGDAFKELNKTTYIRRDGRRQRKTVAYSRPQRSTESGQIIGQQLRAWWAMTRPELMELREDIVTQHRSLADVLTALDALISAMDRHPECGTARDAWESDGRNVDEINLGEVA